MMPRCRATTCSTVLRDDPMLSDVPVRDSVGSQRSRQPRSCHAERRERLPVKGRSTANLLVASVRRLLNEQGREVLVIDDDVDSATRSRASCPRKDSRSCRPHTAATASISRETAAGVDRSRRPASARRRRGIYWSPRATTIARSPSGAAVDIDRPTSRGREYFDAGRSRGARGARKLEQLLRLIANGKPRAHHASRTWRHRTSGGRRDGSAPLVVRPPFSKNASIASRNVVRHLRQDELVRVHVDERMTTSTTASTAAAMARLDRGGCGARELGGPFLGSGAHGMRAGIAVAIRKSPCDCRLGVDQLSGHEQLLGCAPDRMGDHERHRSPAHGPFRAEPRAFRNAGLAAAMRRSHASAMQPPPAEAVPVHSRRS